MTTIILAAGLSSRMGTNKLTLPFDSAPVLAHTIEAAKEVSDRVIVVTGHEKEMIQRIAGDLGVETIYNPDYEKGQRTSALKGLSIVKDDDFAILPGDLPLVTEEDFRVIFSALSKAMITRGTYHAIPGHPVAYRKENRDRLLTYPGTMKEYLKEIGFLKVETSIGTVFDLDTPEKYQALLNCNGNFAILDSYLD